MKMLLINFRKNFFNNCSLPGPSAHVLMVSVIALSSGQIWCVLLLFLKVRSVFLCVLPFVSFYGWVVIVQTVSISSSVFNQ